MSENIPPKKWKLALLIWLFIFPVFAVLSKSLGPYMSQMPVLLQNLIVSIILVPFMVWICIPIIHRKFFKWLRK